MIWADSSWIVAYEHCHISSMNSTWLCSVNIFSLFFFFTAMMSLNQMSISFFLEVSKMQFYHGTKVTPESWISHSWPGFSYSRLLFFLHRFLTDFILSNFPRSQVEKKCIAKIDGWMNRMVKSSIRPDSLNSCWTCKSAWLKVGLASPCSFSHY